MKGRPGHLQVVASTDPSKSLAERNEEVIKRFLKKCTKDGLMKIIYEKSVYSRRYQKPSVRGKSLRTKYKYTAKRNAAEIDGIAIKDDK